MKTHIMRFVKVKCKNCGHLNLIPTYNRLTVEEPIKCENCKEVIVKRDKKSKTLLFYGDTVIP